MRVSGEFWSEVEDQPLSQLVKELQQKLETPAGKRLILWSELLPRLGAQTSGISLDEIQTIRQLQVDKMVLRQELELLQREGLVAEAKGRYYLIRLRKDCRESEGELRTRLLIRKLLVTHLPAMMAGGRGRRMIDHDE